MSDEPDAAAPTEDPADLPPDVLCPLLEREIAAGLCYEIAAEAHGAFKPNALSDVMRATRLSRPAVAAYCAACPYFPLGS